MEASSLKRQKETQFRRVVSRDEPCAPKPVQVKILQSKYEKWMELPAEVRTKILREAIDKALENQEFLLAN